MRRGISRRSFVAGATAGTAAAFEVNRGAVATPDFGQAVSTDRQEQPEVASPSRPEASPHPAHARFSELPLGCIEPQGWLKAYLKTQKEGITGHLDETGGFPFNTYGWAGPGISDVPPEWWAYEQTAYWVDGMIRCGHLLRDNDLIEKASKQINYVLDHPDKDGYLGPEYLKSRNRWPHVVFFRALFAHSSATGDARIVAAIKRHFLSSPYTYAGGRDVCAIEAMLWAYGRDGDPALLRMAEDTYRNMAGARGGMSPAAFMDGKPSQAHGVGYNEAAKLGAILYSYTGNADYLKVSIAAYQKLDQYHLLPEGVNTSTEGLKPVTPLESHETCDITDYAWSVGYLLMATGLAEYSDKIERACFNAAPGAVTEDFKGLQYFSCPNQVIAAHNSNHNLFYKGNRAMAYGPAHMDIAQCCSGNVNRVMPNFAARLWMKDGGNGLVAALYGPSRVTCAVGERHQEVTITENTRYPFSDRIVFTMQMAQDTRFPFTVRIPTWCRTPRISVNGQPLERQMSAGTFVTIDRTFRDKDEVAVVLPQEVKATLWPMDGIVIERGPLVYSLKIEEEWQSFEQVAEAAEAVIGIYDLNKKYPGLVARNAYPKSPWNYALEVDPESVARNVQVSELEWPEEHPFSGAAPPIMLRVPARRVIGWQLEEMKELVQQGDWDHPQAMHTRRGQFVLTPQLPSASGPPVRLADATETITLVPYGCARLRLTIFPQARRVAALTQPQA
jgi:hypothetical protein